MRLLFVVLLAALGNAKPLDNPLSSLMKKDSSPELKAFVEQVLNTITTQVAYSALGLPPSLEEFKNDMANMTILFVMLPIKDQRYIYDNFKGYGESAKRNMSMSMTADMQLLESRLNSAATRLLMEKVDRTCDWMKEHSRCIALIREEDPVLANTLEQLTEKAIEQYNKLKSKAAKDFVNETIEYLVKIKESDVTDENWEHVKKNFAKLSHPDKLDVVRKMTWLMDPLYEQMHSMVTAVKINK